MLEETIKNKEQNLRLLMETLRNELNQKRLKFNSNKNDWTYLTSLSTAEENINVILNYIKETNKL